MKSSASPLDDAASLMLETSPLRSMTGETITSPVDLMEQLKEVGPLASPTSRKNQCSVNSR
jgi:hypothetical protein